MWEFFTGIMYFFHIFYAISTSFNWVVRPVGSLTIFLQQKCLGQFGTSETVNNNFCFPVSPSKLLWMLVHSCKGSTITVLLIFAPSHMLMKYLVEKSDAFAWIVSVVLEQFLWSSHQWNLPFPEISLRSIT